jgi:colicin import membrane protein
MKLRFDYGLGILVSFALHGVLIGAIYLNWDPEISRIIIQPDYIKAELVQLNSMKKMNDKSEQPNLIDKKSADRRRLEEKNKAEQAIKKKRSEKIASQKHKEQLEKERQERLLEEIRKKDQVEREKLFELERLRRQKEVDKKLAREQLIVKAKNEERQANSYRQVIQRRLSQSWSRPPSARRGMETTIRLQLVPTGRVVGVTILSSSGDTAFDRSVEQAAFKAAPFEELRSMSPVLFENKFRQVDVLFSPQDLRL